MILTPHLLFGAAIASQIQNPISAIILAFLSHYFLDFLPHNEYSIKNITEKRWKKSFPDFLKVFVDFSIGVILILAFSQKTLTVFIAAFFAILPDGFNIFNCLFKNNVLKSQSEFHQKKIHFLKYKKFSSFWRILSQAIVIISSIILLKL